MPIKILITGGCGFIGSNLIRYLMRETDCTVCNFDAQTYAGLSGSLDGLRTHPRYQFERGDIGDFSHLKNAFASFSPDAVMHLAAESHVDRSIDGPGQFIQTNIVGTFNLLQATLGHWRTLSPDKAKAFRFLHVSTDEVFGSLGLSDLPFSEKTSYDPRSPYSASKAASDHLVRAWHHTYGLPVIVTNCSNNYGPYQFPEKLIPVVILKALRREPIPVYGKGENVRDWLYVEDHARALWTVMQQGRVGDTYCIGGNNERRNIDLVRLLCKILDELSEDPDYRFLKTGPSRNTDVELPLSHSEPPVTNHKINHSFEQLITFVTDRPGHDHRYAIDSSKIQQELGWRPLENTETGLRKTVRWYLDNREWWERILTGEYKLERMGVGE